MMELKRDINTRIVSRNWKRNPVFLIMQEVLSTLIMKTEVERKKKFLFESKKIGIYEFNI